MLVPADENDTPQMEHNGANVVEAAEAFASKMLPPTASTTGIACGRSDDGCRLVVVATDAVMQSGSS